MKRCTWKNLENSELYQDYHDNQWGIACYDDKILFEMFILETFHCGLSWLIILKKRENFRKAFDDFDAIKISKYDEPKIEKLMQDEGIVRNKAKILATIENAKAYLKILEEFKTFSDYIWSFTDNKIQYLPHNGTRTKNELSDIVSKDLKKRGFKFMGTVTCFSYLEAVGIMNNHSKDCFKYIDMM